MRFRFLQRYPGHVAIRCLLGLSCMVGGLGRVVLRAAEVFPLFSQRNWYRANGLPSNEVTDLCMDRVGYLWIATATGLVRFDGAQFVNHPFAPAGAQTTAGLAVVVADPRDDGLWAAPRAGGLVRFRHGAFEPVSLPAPFSGKQIAELLFARDGALWISFTGGEVLRWRGEAAFEVFDSRNGLGTGRVTHLACDGTGEVWLANGTLLAKYVDGVLCTVPVDSHTDDLRIASARQDGPWVLGRGWLHKMVGGRLGFTVKVSGHFNERSVQALLEDSTGAIWTGTRSRGVRRLKLPGQSDLAILTPEDIDALLEDRFGNIWAGSNGGGLVRVREGVLQRYGRGQGLLENYSLSVCQDNEGTIWLANRDGGVAFINEEGRIKTLGLPRVRETFSALSIAPAGPAGIWVASSHGLLRADKTGLASLDGPDAVPQPPVHGEMRVCLTAANGDIWLVVAPGKLGRMRNGEWRFFGENDGLPLAAISSIAEDAQGQIWAGGEEATLCRLDGERFIRVPIAVAGGAGAIQAIHFDASGAGWLGTARAGLLRLGDSNARALDEAHGLPANNITQVISDDFGALWFGSPEGIFHVRRDELEEFFLGRISRVDAVVIGMDEGLNEATCLGAYQPSVWKSRDGTMWFATRQGLVAIDPLRSKVPSVPLVIRIESLRANGVAHQATGTVSLSATAARSVEFDYSVLCLSTPDRVRTRVRLRGYDDEWTIVDARGPARYTRLPPGTYVFEVAAHIAGASGTAAIATLPIAIEAAWWQTPWFQGGMAVLSVALGALAIRAWSHRRLRVRLAELEHASALERERARIAQNIHDELGAGLTRVSLLTQSADPGDGRTHLDKIYRTVSGLTQSMDEIVWAVNPKNDDLENLANYVAEYAQGFLSDANIRCRVLLPDVLPRRTLTAQVRHHLFLSCKEALHNIVKHSRATEATVRLDVVDDHVTIAVSDNGRGFSVAPVPASCARNGLKNMQARLEALGGTCALATSSAGTTVTLRTPLSPESPEP